MLGVVMDIAERKRAEMNAEHLASFPQLNPNPVLEVDSGGKVIYSNRAAKKALTRAGLDEADVDVYVPANLNEIFGNWDGKEDLCISHEVELEGKVFAETIHFTSRFNVARIYAFDITETKRVEKALKESEALYRAIGESIDYGVWVCAPDGRNIYASESFLKMVGITQEQCSNFGWGDVLHPDDAERTIAAWQECVRMGGNWDIEHRFRSVEGQWRYVLARGVPVKNDQGEITCWAGINLDTTDRKKAVEKLRESELFFRQTLASIPGMVFTTRPDGYCDYQSQQWVDFTGVPMSEHLGDGWNKLLHPDDRPRALAAWQAAVQESAPYDLEYRVRRHDGAFEWFKVRGRPIRNSEGEIVRWFGTALNINDLVIVKDQLQQAKDAAEMATKVKSQFLANMSHELRTPMTGVLGMLDLTLEGPLAAEQREFIEKAHASALALIRILNDILDLSKLEAGKLLLDEKPFSLRNFVETTFNLLLPAAMNKGLDLDFTVADDVPETLIGDQTRLNQILMNLAGNAVKFTEKGKVELRIAAGGNAPGGRREVTFTVVDTGIGIPDDKRDLLFRVFSQVDASHSRIYGGTGLGLAISKEIVELMGGTIDFTSDEGKGSVFFFTIPLGEAESERDDILASGKQRRWGTSPRAEGTKKPRLLVAEDEPTIRQVLGLMFQRSNYEIDFAENGQKVVEMWDAGKYDLILMDVQMPRMNGFEAAGAIREKERIRGGHIPIVAMTAHAFKEDEERCIAAGMDAYISKPIDYMKTLQLIGETLKRTDVGR